MSKTCLFFTIYIEKKNQCFNCNPSLHRDRLHIISLETLITSDIFLVTFKLKLPCRNETHIFISYKDMNLNHIANVRESLYPEEYTISM